MRKGSLGRDAIEAMRAVVRIHAEGLNETNCQSILDPRFVMPMQWTGSGFFIEINGDKGYLLTNAHVARNATILQCMSLLTSEEYFQLECVGVVETLDPDIALLRMPADEIERFESIAGQPIPALKFAEPDELSRGMDIKAIGYPLGMSEPNISGGEISNFISGDFSFSERVVTDAAINPGNSGGPAVMLGGKVVGLNTATISDASNIGFITPAIYCKILMENLLHARETRLAHLGAFWQKNSEANAHWLKQDTVEGIILTKIYKNGMCHQAGLKKWDVLLGFDDYRFDRHGILLGSKLWTHHQNIYDIMRRQEVGKQLTLHVRRKGELLHIETEARPMPWMRLRSHPVVAQRRYLFLGGMIVQEASYEVLAAFAETYDLNAGIPGAGEISDKPCLLITHIVQGSPAEKVELEIGDLISKVNGRPIFSLKALAERIATNEEAHVVFETREGRLGIFDGKVFSEKDSRIHAAGKG